MSAPNLEQTLFDLEGIEDSKEYLIEAIEFAGSVPLGGSDPGAITKVGVLGAGSMGRGIALAFAQTGRGVDIVDPAATALASAEKHIANLIERSRSRQKLTDKEAIALRDRISFSSELAAFAGADIVVEAVPEIMSLKQKVMSDLEGICQPNTILATNTSTLDVDEIARDLKDPARFIGTHFFIPAQVNRLLEVIPAKASSPATLSTTMNLALSIKKNAVIAANGDGFIGNRLFDRFHQEAMYLVEEGAWPDEVDDALEKWGMAIGPFRALDLVGNDIPWGVRKQRAERPVPPHQPRIGDALCEANLFGQKTGKGWYLYDAATPKGRAHEEARALIIRTSRELGKRRRSVLAPEIVGRCILSLILEGMKMLEEQRAERASDIDMVFTTGYGFPRAMAGPMRLGQELGASNVAQLARHYGQISTKSDTVWTLPASLEKGRAKL
jgi:3-hydroxyacyl-CoA dehydrogenase